MTEWAAKFIPAEEAPQIVNNPSFNILVGVIEDTIRESLGEGLPESDDRMDRVLAGLVSLSDGISQQLMMIVRRIDDLERVLDQSINDVPVTNLMQDAPDVYERIMDDEDEEIEDEDGEEEHPGDVILAYESYLNEEIKWTDFVKVAGGVANAVQVRENYEDMIAPDGGIGAGLDGSQE